MTIVPRLALALLFAPAAAVAGDPFFTGVGDLPGGNVLSAANGVSGDGAVVAGYSNTATGDEAIRWTQQGGLQGLGDLPGGATYSQARAVSADGSTIVGSSTSASGGEGFRWLAGSGPVGVGDLPGNAFFSIASGVNTDGTVVVGHSESTNSGTLSAEAFRWTLAGGIAGLGDLPGSIFFSVATGSSADGTRVCGYGTSTASGPSSSEASRWVQGVGMVGLGDLAGGGFGGNAFGISADGNAIVGLSAATGGVFAFRWTDPAAGGAGMESLGDLPGGSAFSRANGVSADGKVVVGQSVGPNGMEAFVWIEGQGIFALKNMLQNDLGLDLTGWTLEVAQAVSADGRTIVGYGPNPDGNYEGWVAHLGGAPWNNVGHALAGDDGLPLLSGLGTPAGGNVVTLTLSGARPDSTAALIIGLTQVLAPLKGGVLVPAADVLVAGLPVSHAGKLVLSAAWPAGVPSGLTISFQEWIVDAAAVQGFSASNGLTVTIP